MTDKSLNCDKKALINNVRIIVSKTYVVITNKSSFKRNVSVQEN